MSVKNHTPAHQLDHQRDNTRRGISETETSAGSSGGTELWSRRAPTALNVVAAPSAGKLTHQTWKLFMTFLMTPGLELAGLGF